MKKTRLFFGAIALTFSLAAALAFKAAPVVDEPAILNAQNECTKVTASCPGGEFACKTSSGQQIYNRVSSTNCAPMLQRATP